MATKKKPSFVKLFSYFKPYRFATFFSVAALIITALSILSYGYLARMLVDDIANSKEVAKYFYLSAFVAISLALSVGGFFRSYLINNTSFKIVSDLRKEMFVKCLNFPMNFFDSNSPDKLSNVILKDLEDIFNLFTKNITFFLRNLILFIVGFVLMITISFKLFMVMLTSFILLSLPVIALVKNFKISFVKFKGCNSDLSGFVSQSLHFIKLIKSSNAQNRLESDLELYSSEMMIIFRKKMLLQSLMVAVAILFSFVAIAAILFFGSDQVIKGFISQGDFTSFIFNAVISSVAVVGLAQSLVQIIKIVKNADDSFAVLQSFSEALEEGDNLDLEDIKKIEFKNVNFSYRGESVLVLKDLSFEIVIGNKLLLNAPSGSGKSTIFSLMLRFYEIADGGVIVDGKSLSNYSISSIRDNIYFTMQDSFLLSGSVYDNLVFPNCSKTKAEIQNIIDNQECLAFINNLPSGIDTDIGSHGTMLSGGQKQRVSILRALISDAKMLIFDESMSQLDSKNEKAVFNLINIMLEGRTAIFVCHKVNSDFEFDSVISL